ncbi:hypothetical protein, partial [Metamycoplasma equirhinis]|uniref:hypothetical protein n=1 Tax=Metamycoplasma equirhinis TaxID=92402 RepID=UPI003593F9BF
MRPLLKDAYSKKHDGAETGIAKLQKLANDLFLTKNYKFPNDYTKTWQNAWNNKNEIQEDYKMIINEYEQIKDYSGTSRWGSD